MEVRSMAGQRTYLAIEDPAGTAEATGFFGLSGLKLRPGWDGERPVFRGGTGKVPTTTMGTDVVSPWEVDLAPDFNHLGLVLASRFGLPVTSTPGGGTDSRQHIFRIDPDAEDIFRAYTVLWGDGYYALQGVYGYFNSLSMNIQRGTLGFDATFRSRAAQFGYTVPVSEVQTLAVTGGPPTGGTFTLTYSGQTTTTLDWDATAAEIQAALIALSNIGPLDVVCAGGPFPGTPITVTFKGALSQTNVALITANNSLTPSGTVGATETTPGSVPTSIPAIPMPSNMWDVYMDPAWADLGTTQYGGAYIANFDFGEKFDEDAPLNSALVSYEQPVEKAEQDASLDLTIRLGATAQSLADALDDGTPQFVRLSLTGPIIEGVIPYSCDIDVSCAITSKGAVTTAPNSSVTVLPLMLTPIRDDTSGEYANITLVNTVLAY